MKLTGGGLVVPASLSAWWSSPTMTGGLETEAGCLSPQAAIRNGDFGLGRVHVSSLRGIVLQLRDAAPALLVRATEALGLDSDFTATEWK